MTVGETKKIPLGGIEFFDKQRPAGLNRAVMMA